MKRTTENNLNGTAYPTLTGDYATDAALWRLSCVLKTIAESLEGGDVEGNSRDSLVAVTSKRQKPKAQQPYRLA